MISLPLQAASLGYDIEVFGLTGEVYNHSSGGGYMRPEFLNEAGQVAGFSSRYSGTTDLGRDAWFYDGSATVQIGLTGTSYERSNGFRETWVRYLNQAGQVAGVSRQFSDEPYMAYDAWLYDGTATVRIGLAGTGYETSDSEVLFLNEAGQVAGNSERDSGGHQAWRYDGTATVPIGLVGAGYETSSAQFLNEAGHVVGYSAHYGATSHVWINDGVATVRIGLTGAGYEGTDSFNYSVAYDLNQAGQVAGQSPRYSGTTLMGVDAWLYDGADTLQIGLTGTGYEQTDGTRYSFSQLLNEAGQVTGRSARYSVATNLGEDAWIYDGRDTVRIGLVGTGYERADGYRFSDTQFLNEAGQVAGYSERHSDTTDLGQDAWLYDGAATIPIGLTGAGYQRSDGYRYNDAQILNEAGMVAGHANRYIGTANRGQDAWLYDGTTTVRVGMIGSGYTQTNGTRYSHVEFLNEAGQVAGFSERYSGTTLLGYDAWLYDAVLGQQFNLTMSVQQSTGIASSHVLYLGDDGLVLGDYVLFDQNTHEDLGSRAFLFTVDDGLLDLGALVLNMPTEDWGILASAIRANGIGSIVGFGNFDGSSAAYLLTPSAAVPAPATVWLLGSGLGLLGWRRARVGAGARARQ
jgi:hypothetical protein